MSEDRASQITRYFDTMRDQALAYASNRMTIEAMDKLSKSFHRLANELDVDATQERTALSGYYSRQFATEYAKRNNGQQPEVSSLVNQLGDNAVALQQRYINANPKQRKPLLA